MAANSIRSSFLPQERKDALLAGMPTAAASD